MISDEMVEKACLSWMTGCDCELCRSHMRAALSAVLPLIVEKCAEVADKGVGHEYNRNYDNRAIASAIRSLARP